MAKKLLRSSILLILLSLLLIIFGPSLLEAANPLYNFCGSTGGNYTANSTYASNLRSLLGSISSDNSITYGFYNFSAGQTPDVVNGIGLCRGDVALSDCRACLKNASSEIVQTCPVQRRAVIWYDNCMLRYSDENIFGVVASGDVFYMWNSNNATSVTEFNTALRQLMDGLRSRAAAGSSTRKFAAGNTTGPDFTTLYGLAQCTPDLSEQQCNDCLVAAIGNIPDCCNGKKGGRVVGPSCNIRFEVYRFYDASAELESPSASPASHPTPTTATTNNGTAPPSQGKSSNTTRTVIIVVVVSVGAVWLLFGILCFFCCRKKRRSIEHVETMDDEIGSAESLQYDFATVRAATDNFSEENKLGQGGFGAVYKGMLPNGQDVAVKRLSRGLGQGDQEFKTEVLLVARLQHRNLVRLLGFCLSGDERLLVYEFVPLSSLDRFIFDPVKRQQLDWERRQKIIGGIARGLVYLHEDSRLRIIHRDLKASNVLLDDEMIPKIADFGMARLFVMDETHAATNRIVGTYGYMSPEYALYGHFSQKSDVFSFGILLLEIVSGQKNNAFRSGETVEDLPSSVWRSWREGMIENVIDPALRDGSRTEMLRCIHIGLLCIQENAANRPNMSAVVLMLNSFSISLPVPTQPALFMHSNIDQTGDSFSATNSLTWAASDVSKSKSREGSDNDVSITNMVPR